MKVLIADKLPAQALEAFTGAGFEITNSSGLKAEELAEAIKDHEILVVRSTKVNAETMHAGKRLHLVIRAGAGFNTIDVAAASKRGIYVANCPGKNAIAVAELAIGLLLGLDRQIPMAHADLKQSRWKKGKYGKADGLFGKKIGIVGFGPIGKATAHRARALGLEVHAWSRSLTPQDAQRDDAQCADSLLDLAKKCDILSLHLPLNDGTRGLIDADILNALGDSGMVINCSRGGVVNEDAIIAALQKGTVRYATDVYAEEPSSGDAEFKSAIAQHADTLCTPHIGASTEQAQMAVAQEALRIASVFRDTGKAPRTVNLGQQSQTKHSLSVRHIDRVGALASILDILKTADINVQELENTIFSGSSDAEQAAVAHIHISKKPGSAEIDAIRELPAVIDLQVRGK